MAFVAITLSMTFSSCSNDNADENKASNNNEVNPSNVFTGDRIQKAGTMAFTYDKDGFVTSINDDGSNVTFQYVAATRSGRQCKEVIITIPGDDAEPSYTITCQIGNNGFISSGIDSSDHDTWAFEYDGDGHLIKMVRSEGNNTVSTMTYKDGDIVSSTEIDDDDIAAEKKGSNATISYTSANYATPIENKGGVMEFDEMFNVDMDEMSYAYYAGLLGKPTKHLPLACNRTYDSAEGETGDELLAMVWTFNKEGYPTQLKYTEDGIPVDDWHIDYEW